MIASTGHTIILTPIGALEADLLTLVMQAVTRFTGFAVEILPLLSDLAFAFDPGRRQYHSTAILERLAVEAPSRALKVIGITEVDLFIPILTHVYGEAQLDGRTCIVSTYRLNTPLGALEFRERFRCRMTKEVIHELGHTFNLRHCTDSACIMHYCRRIEDVDRKSDRLCRYCDVLLADEIKRLTC